MAYDEELADRVRDSLSRWEGLTERRMFGGIAFMLSGNMAAGVLRDALMVRVGPDGYEDALAAGAAPMSMGHREMRGFVSVGRDELADPATLDAWVARGADHAAALPPK
ncbi:MULTISPECIES: TfoX/Sxy family protein [unclassified Isoptericola]|uniref:TfoX/Sxy family protein n=1 Tax=unclassified Isoptericola TaxID=2623355 RepID=UPI0027138F4D|nr:MULTISPECIES: TfoX/Sxy family protein [unclassified Isoptericola]MDO8145270.1 TfoX/Sxy family protein [Isoptericola sp. 178]MDO8148906.1 TfoX/Sxy family protein [Isoptericola sp. b515]MDO8151151.1 TfoX/Sxy family protein [Isoptericola sp. b408]